MSDQRSASGNRVFAGAWRRRRVIVVAAGVAVLAAGGAAYATIPDAGTQVIHSCYDNSTGALRVIDPSKGQSCAASETALSWNGRGLNFRGGWSATTPYSQGDVVTLGGGSYVAKTGNLNSPPPSANWAVLGNPSYSNVASSSNEFGGVFPVILSANETKVINTTGVPAGNYTVNATVTLFIDNDALDVQCRLFDTHGNTSNVYAETSGPPNHDSGVTGVVQTINLSDAFPAEPAKTQFSVRCAMANGADPDNSEAVAASIEADAVGHLILNNRQFITGG